MKLRQFSCQINTIAFLKTTATTNKQKVTLRSLHLHVSLLISIRIHWLIKQKKRFAWINIKLLSSTKWIQWKQSLRLEYQPDHFSKRKKERKKKRTVNRTQLLHVYVKYTSKLYLNMYLRKYNTASTFTDFCKEVTFYSKHL